MSEAKESYWDLKAIVESKSRGPKIQKLIRVWNTFKGNGPENKLLAGHALEVFSSSPYLYKKPDSPYYGFVKENKRGDLIWTGKIEYMEKNFNIPSQFTSADTKCFYTCWMTDLFNPAISASFQAVMFEKMRDFKYHEFILQTEYWDRYVDFASGHDVAENIRMQNVELNSMRYRWKNKMKRKI